MGLAWGCFPRECTDRCQRTCHKVSTGNRMLTGGDRPFRSDTLESLSSSMKILGASKKETAVQSLEPYGRSGRTVKGVHGRMVGHGCMYSEDVRAFLGRHVYNSRHTVVEASAVVGVFGGFAALWMKSKCVDASSSPQTKLWHGGVAYYWPSKRSTNILKSQHRSPAKSP